MARRKSDVAALRWAGETAGGTVVVVPAGAGGPNLEPLARRVTVRGEPRLALDDTDVVELIAHLGEQHERRSRVLRRTAARATGELEESAAAVRAAKARLKESHARVDALNASVAALHDATDATTLAQEVIERAEAELDAAEAWARRLEDDHDALACAIRDADLRIRAYEAQIVDAVAWDDADLGARVGRARAEADGAHNLAGEARALALQTEAIAAEVEQCRVILQAAAAACRQRLEGASADDGQVRAALQAYESAAAGRGPDPHAVRLANEVAELTLELERVRASRASAAAPEALDAARQQVATAATQLEEAQGSVQRRLLTAEERAELEDAHRLLTAGERGIGAGMLGGRSKRREQAQARLDSLLARYGFTDFLDYRLHHAHGDGATGAAVERARVQLERARAELTALEQAGGPTDEERDLERTLAELHREGSELLGFDPGDRLEECLLRKPDVPAEATRCLIDALISSGAAPPRRAADDEARAWLAGLEAERQARTRIESELAVVNAQLAIVESVGWRPDELDVIARSAEAVIALAEDRERHARRVAHVLEVELGARRDADAQLKEDASRARHLAAGAAAVQRLRDESQEQSEERRRRAAEALAHARADADAARRRHDDACRDLSRLVTSASDPNSLVTEAFAEVELALARAGQSHEELVVATDRHERARTALADACAALERHAAIAPPAVRDEPEAIGVVAMLLPIAGRNERSLAVVLPTDGVPEAVTADIVDTVVELSREHWVVTTVPVLQAAGWSEDERTGLRVPGVSLRGRGYRARRTRRGSGGGSRARRS